MGALLSAGTAAPRKAEACASIALIASWLWAGSEEMGSAGVAAVSGEALAGGVDSWLSVLIFNSIFLGGSLLGQLP